MKHKQLCPHCQAAMVEYRHSLSVGLVQGLIRLAESGAKGEKNLRDLHLTRTQWDNFQKLRYWGLVEKVGERRKGGVWRITRKGWDFLAFKCPIQRVVVTYRGEAQRFEGPLAFVHEIVEGYQYRGDYADEAVAHGEGRLF